MSNSEAKGLALLAIGAICTFMTTYFKASEIALQQQQPIQSTPVLAQIR